jgi:ribosomal protein S18 acetylase RimI-like enzyme
MPIELRHLQAGDDALLDRVADDIFDNAIDPQWTREFLANASNHMFVAIDAEVVVGMISAVDYVHPDKARQLWINEVGVTPASRRQGIARRLLRAMLAHARAIGCTEAWLGTEVDNIAARALYESSGSKPEQFVLYSFALGDE